MRWRSWRASWTRWSSRSTTGSRIPAVKHSGERRRYREGHKRGEAERRAEEEDEYFDRTKRTKRPMPESREILESKLAYKEKMLVFLEGEATKEDAKTP